MPLTRYYGGHGKEVMAKMKRQYGPDKGKEVFYATNNKRKKLRKQSRKPSTGGKAAPRPRSFRPNSSGTYF